MTHPYTLDARTGLHPLRGRNLPCGSGSTLDRKSGLHRMCPGCGVRRNGHRDARSTGLRTVSKLVKAVEAKMDVVYLVIILLSFGASLGFVKLCERL